MAHHLSRGCGGIGRRARLRSSVHDVGSSPSPALFKVLITSYMLSGKQLHATRGRGGMADALG